MFTELIGPKEKDKDLDISDNFIYSNRMSMEELKLLPKFANYDPGPQSKVSGSNNFSVLYLFVSVI